MADATEPNKERRHLLKSEMSKLGKGGAVHRFWQKKKVDSIANEEET